MIASNKIFERDDRMRLHKQRLIKEYLPSEFDNMKDVIDISINTAMHLSNEFATIDMVEDDIRDIKKLLEKNDKGHESIYNNLVAKIDLVHAERKIMITKWGKIIGVMTLFILGIISPVISSFLQHKFL